MTEVYVVYIPDQSNWPVAVEMTLDSLHLVLGKGQRVIAVKSKRNSPLEVFNITNISYDTLITRLRAEFPAHCVVLDNRLTVIL